jgi:hypothetical protein
VGSGEFESPEAFYFEMTTVMCTLKRAKRPLTQEEVASFIVDRDGGSILTDSVVKKIKRYCEKYRNYGCAWKALKRDVLSQP